MSIIHSQFYHLQRVAAFVCFVAVTAFGNPEDNPPQDQSNLGLYIVCIMMVAGTGAGLYFWKKSKESRVGLHKSEYNYQMSYNHGSIDSYDMDDVDAERDLEWLRKAKRTTVKQPMGERTPPETPPAEWASLNDAGIETKAFQEKMRKLQYTQLPINSFGQLASVKRYTPLESSDDPGLLAAIEKANEDFEEDEAVRELSLRVLTAFRFRNSVDAIEQMALYDLSSNLRSKAVTVLADFDHESVFETILLACADPTREVRAAAARGLFRLSFDRAHAWKRIIAADDEFRMRHAARAAVESGIVSKSFDRLVHEDTKIAYEAFALVSLLIKAGETETIFDAIRDHKDERVKYALLHVLKVHREGRTLEKLNELRVGRSLPTDLADRIRDTVKSFEQFTTWSSR